MKLAIIIIGIIAIGSIALQLVSHIVAKKETDRFNKMSPDERRKYQEEMYKRHQMG